VPTTDHDRTHEALSPEECLFLLGTTTVGRVAYTEGALPAIRPVSFALRDQEVLIPALAGSRFLEAFRGSVVAFEADDYDAEKRTGWVVSVVGTAHVLDAPAEPPSPDLVVVAVRLGIVQGWRTSLPT
jgi:uncharacterized protein